MSFKHLLYTIIFGLYVVIPANAKEVTECSVPLDTLLTAYYERAASLMGEGELDSAQWYFDKAFAMEGVKQSPVYPILLNEQGTLFFYFGQLEKARKAKQAVLPYLSQIDDLEKHVSVYNDLGILSHRFNQNDSAIYYYNKALDAAERYKDDSWLANLHMNVSVFYHNLKRLNEAEQHIDQAVKYVVRTDDQQTILYTWQVRAAIKAKVGKLAESGESMKRAWSIACANGGNTDWKMRCIPSLYRYFKSSNQPDSASYYIAVGNELIEKLPANGVSVTGFIQVRQEENYEKGRYKEALEDLLRLGIQQAGTNKIRLYEKMAHCYKHLNNLPKAFAYMDSARMWTDSISAQKVTEGIANFEVKYKTQAKELEIAQLQQKIFKKEATLLRVGFVLVVLVFLILIVVYRSRQKRQEIEKQIEIINHEKELSAAQHYIKGVEEECKYFAKELHDGIANDLLGLQFKMNELPEQARNNLPDLVGKIRSDVRSISHELMPPEFNSLTLQQILEYYIEGIQENTGIKTLFNYTQMNDTQKGEEAISNEVARGIYRIVQEKTSNIIKHGAASTIEVNLDMNIDGLCKLTIQDNGKPFKLTDIPHTNSIGMRTIQDRVKALDGTLEQKNIENINIFIVTFRYNHYDLPNNSH